MSADHQKQFAIIDSSLRVHGIAVFLGVLAAWVANTSAAAIPDKDQSAVTQYPWLKDFRHREFGPNGEVLREVSARRLYIAPRHIFAFNLHSFNELRLERPVIKLFPLNQDGLRRAEHLDLTANLLPAELRGAQANRDRRPLGFVTRVVVSDDVLVEIYKSREDLALFVRASGAYANDTSGNVTFVGATLTNENSSITIIADRIIWQMNPRQFVIPGAYVARTPRGVAKGRAIAVDLGFKVRSL